MINIEEATNKIITSLASIIEEKGGDVRWVICSERAFVSDFVPRYDEHVKLVSDSADLQEREPYDGPYDEDKLDWDNTIFAVVKVGGGDTNQGVMAANASITLLSCNHDFQETRNILNDFVRAVNFEYIDGIIQSYLPPSISQSMTEVYDGFRALMGVSGIVKIPASDQLLFVTNLYYVPSTLAYDSEEIGTLYTKAGNVYTEITVAEETNLVGKGYYKKDKNGLYIPADYVNVNFLSYTFQDSKAQDPQAFLNDSLYGITQNVNRQGTVILSFATYLFIGDGFTDLVRSSIKNQNKFVKMGIRCSGSESDGSAYFWYEGEFSIIGHNAAGEWGDMNVFTINMTSGENIFNG